jgi:hypothetical protein
MRFTTAGSGTNTCALAQVDGTALAEADEAGASPALAGSA